MENQIIKTKKAKVRQMSGLFLCCLFFTSVALNAQINNDTLKAKDLTNLSFDELLNVKVITASKKEEKISEAPAIMSIITAKEIEMYASNNLADILDRAAGSFIYGSYYLPDNMIALRGEVTSHYCTHVLILINGRPLRSSKEGYYLPVLHAFPINSIEQIEILKGPGSALYGSGAYVGIINIITKEGNSQPTTASIQYGSFGTGIAQVSTGFEKNDFYLTAAGYYMNSDGWDYKVRGATTDSLYNETNTPAIEKSRGINLTSSYKNLSLNVFAGSNYRMIAQDIQEWWYADEWYLGTTNVMADLGYSHQFGEKLTSTVNGSYNYLKYWQPYDVHANDLREKGVFNDFLIELTNLYQPNTNLSVTVGALANLQSGNIYNTETLSDGTPYNVWLQPKNPDPSYVVPDYNEIWWSFYSNLNYKPTNYLSITAGAHANKDANLSLDIVPRLGAVLNFNFPLTFKVLYGQAFRSPDVFELYSKVEGIYGNKLLKPEKITTYEAQLIYNHKNFYVAISYFNNTQKNVIGRSLAQDSLLIVNGIPQETFINSEALNSQGIEFESKIHFSPNLSMSISSLYHINEDLNGKKNIYGLPNLFIKTSLLYSQDSRMSIGLSNMWVSKGNEFDVPYPNANPAASAFNYMTLKISSNLTQLFKLSDMPDLIINVSGINLLDAGVYYPEYSSRNINTIPGRSGIALYAGLKIKF